jgi:hypothetical protein
MADTCTIRREVSHTTDPDSGDITPTYTQVYPDPDTGDTAGPCRIQQARPQARREDAGEASRLMVTRELQLPVATSLGVRADDEVVVVTCVQDPELVGHVFRVREETSKSEATSRRLGIEEATS